MIALSDEIVFFLEKQEHVIVSTLEPSGGIHCSVKGIVGIEKEGKVFLIDLYFGRTFQNLKRNPAITITSVDGHRFVGYALSGKARIVEREKIRDSIIAAWEERVIRRISQRMLRDIKEESRAAHHPESMFPHPQYLIEIDVKKITDLAPAHLKKPEE